jgi:hypothetical protein
LLSLRGIILLTLLVWAAANEGQPKDKNQDLQEVLEELRLEQQPSMLETMNPHDPTNFNNLPKERKLNDSKPGNARVLSASVAGSEAWIAFDKT